MLYYAKVSCILLSVNDLIRQLDAGILVVLYFIIEIELVDNHFNHTVFFESLQRSAYMACILQSIVLYFFK